MCLSPICKGVPGTFFSTCSDKKIYHLNYFLSNSAILIVYAVYSLVFAKWWVFDTDEVEK